MIIKDKMAYPVPVKVIFFYVKIRRKNVNNLKGYFMDDDPLVVSKLFSN